MKISARILCLVWLMMFLAACGGSPGVEPTTDANFVLTAGVETMVAAFFQTQTALYTPPVDTSTPFPETTGTSLPSLTPTLAASPTNPLTYYYYTATLGTGTPSLTPTVTGTVLTATVDPASVASGCNNLALVFDVTVPNGTNFKSGEEFTKIWKVENNGTCNWIHSYKLVFVSGEQMGGAAQQRLARTISPGNWTELSVALRAPDKKGTYTGYWRMTDTDGKAFGVNLAVTIKVGSPPTETPKPPTSTATPTASSTATSEPSATATEETTSP